MNNIDKINKYINDENYIFRKGNIVWIDFPEDVKNKSIQSGKRKALIYSNTANNICSPNIHVIPLTTKNKKFKLHSKRLNNRDYYCVEQLMPIDKKYVEINSEVERVNPIQEDLLDELVLVQLGMKEYIDINMNYYKERMKNIS